MMATRWPDYAVQVYEGDSLIGSIRRAVPPVRVTQSDAEEAASIGAHRFLSSGDIDEFRELGGRLLGPELADIQVSELGAKYFSAPSPGEANEAGFIAFVGDTRFTVDRGFYQNPFDVEITTATPDESSSRSIMSAITPVMRS